jgi:hypothetical protein
MARDSRQPPPVTESYYEVSEELDPPAAFVVTGCKMKVFAEY